VREIREVSVLRAVFAVVRWWQIIWLFMGVF